jgi:hypothetical protein
MILNLTYNFYYNDKEKEPLIILLNNIKIYLISTTFYIILYLILVYLKNNLLKKILYIILIVDLVSLIINIISNVVPDEYKIIKSIKKKLNLYKE